ncbi:glycine--tRNA ligase subunit beta [Pelotomaculum sp. PtaB.Bin117]|uniref:glycine--tRNA ligase subunit beta n=1 Tax=Pelotomaculum sp. PtaB.Bin117 TaxID=1811694 RepID=UPI0009D107F8|nr:glycine--tRNA ligase subunit beta [Pelotomaculum sp. PtaB.Bin117]OPX87081.1 MAG: Glycine--tRNA ligase beta subunit [Pelotomaculum sp. PtaB.Bin117]
MAGNSSDFLLEIGVEEMPARFLDPALAELKDLAAAALKEQRLEFIKVETYGTPRRLTLFVEGLAESQAPLETEAKGPAVKVAYNPDGTPTKAAEGFARGQGVPVASLVQKTVGKVDYVFAVKREAGRQAVEVLPLLAPALIAGLHFPKPMRWGDLEIRFARPIRWIVALFGSDIVPFEFAGHQAGRATAGHRFLSKGPIEVSSPAEYFEKMRQSFVMVDPRERRETIWRQVQELAASAGGKIEQDEDLLNEVNNLLEYPTALMGDFSPQYLNLPKEVLVTEMREHQRYFPVTSAGGGLLPKFIAVRNGGAEYIEIVMAGNEKVLRARLADADFFFKEDLKAPLVEKVPALKKIVFQESLGSIYDKVVRVSELTEYLAGVLGADEQEKKCALRAAYLAKADLVTNMVYEFPELQGVMGREYAERSGEGPGVATAIYEHYLPRFASDDLPGTIAGRMLSIADKMDNIVGCFAIGIQPSGSQDPYALRRQALGISHILLAGGIKLSLEKTVEKAYRCYEGKVSLKLSLGEVTKDVAEFFKHRLKGILEDRGFHYDTVEAVLASGCDDFSDAFKRVQALADFRSDPAFDNLLTAFIRANNLSKKTVNIHIDPERLVDPSEKILFESLDSVRGKVEKYQADQDYRSQLAAIAALQEPLDRFFNSVMVMVDDQPVRENRLALLLNLAALVKQVADLSKIVVDAK